MRNTKSLTSLLSLSLTVAAASLFLAGPAVIAQQSGSSGQPVDVKKLVQSTRAQLTDPAKPFSLLVDLSIKKGQETQFEHDFAPVIRATRREPGNMHFELNRDPKVPGRYFLYEQWRSLAMNRRHLAMPYMTSFFPKFFADLAGPPVTRVVEVCELP